LTTGKRGVLMIKIKKKLTTDQKKRGVIFSSTLSNSKTEQTEDYTHVILFTDKDKKETKKRLLYNDLTGIFENFKYNIIRC